MSPFILVHGQWDMFRVWRFPFFRYLESRVSTERLIQENEEWKVIMIIECQ